MPVPETMRQRRADPVAPPRGMRRPVLLCLACATLIVAIGACEGDFPRPTLDNPNDPANDGLPATPVIDSVHGDCGGDDPIMFLDWSINSEANIAEYQVYRSSSADADPGDLILHVPVGNTQVIDDDGIEVDLVYYYRVRSVDVTGRVSLRSDPVNERSEITCPPPLTAPTPIF